MINIDKPLINSVKNNRIRVYIFCYFNIIISFKKELYDNNIYDNISINKHCAWLTYSYNIHDIVKPTYLCRDLVQAYKPNLGDSCLICYMEKKESKNRYWLIIVN